MRPRQLVALIAFKTYAQLRAEASRYFLSMLWWVFDPVLSMMVYYLVFGLLLQRGGPDFVPFLLVGIVVWQWLERSALHGMASINGNGALMNLIRIPKLYFPAVTTTVDTVKFAIVFVLLLVFVWAWGYPPSAAYLALPVLILLELALLAGLSLLLAAVMPLLPDLKYLAEVSLRLGFFGSGVLFPASIVPEAYQALYRLNPMVNLIEAYRDVLIRGVRPDWSSLTGVVLAASVLLVAGLLVLWRLEHVYPRWLSR